MKFRYSFPLVMMLALLVPAMALHAAEGVLIEAEGKSSIVDGNTDRAREMALLDAKRQAVENVVGTFVDVRTEVANFQSIRDTISASSNGFVASFEIINEWSANNIYTVNIKAVVKKDALRQKIDELKQTIAAAGKPRVLVLIAEEPDEGIIGAELAKTLIASGFPVVAQTRSEPINAIQFIRKALAGDASAISQLALEHQAEILIIGQAGYDRIGNYQGLISCRGSLEVKAVRSATGQVLAINSFTDTGVAIAESQAAGRSFVKIAQKAGPYLRSELGKQLTDNQRSLQLEIQGVTYTEIKLFQQHLQNTPFITGCYLRGFDQNTARFDLDTSLLAQQLAEQISAWNGLSLEVIGISGNKIEIKKK